MKQAKVLHYKTVRQSISWGWGIRALIRVGLRILIACLPLLPFIALATPFLLPETPHLRVKYTYTGSSSHPIYRECEYLGIHGWVYTVFNVEQIEGLPAHYYFKPEPRLNPIQRIEHAEQFFAALKADIRHGGTMAYYAQEADYIRMPIFEAFSNAESYYATLAHESTHWTKHPSRLDRQFGRKTWGDEGYAEEELVAELGAAFLCADLELSLQPREDHASYIAHWLKVLQNDKRAIFRAAAHAQRAADLLHKFQSSSQEAAYSPSKRQPFRSELTDFRHRHGYSARRAPYCAVISDVISSGGTMPDG